ncbi:MAG: SCO family protein [Betaproteobacteria bacterium]|nr:SCO family protein [Betaproteobacteria bacterium]
MSIRTLIAAALLAALLPAAAAEPGDSSGSGWGGDFEFIDDAGRLRRLSSLAPVPLAVYFGYSNCPDKCAQIMARLAAARKEAGGNPRSFKVLFITVDPERDSRIVLRDFLKLFGAGFIGGRIPPSQLRSVAGRFGVHYESFAGGRLGVGQGEQIHFFDGRGQPASVIGSDAEVAELAATIASLLP